MSGPCARTESSRHTRTSTPVRQEHKHNRGARHCLLKSILLFWGARAAGTTHVLDVCDVCRPLVQARTWRDHQAQHCTQGLPLRRFLHRIPPARVAIARVAGHLGAYVRGNKRKPPGMPRAGEDMWHFRRIATPPANFVRAKACTVAYLEYLRLIGDATHLPLWHLRRVTTTTAGAKWHDRYDPVQDARPQRPSPASRRETRGRSSNKEN